MSKSYENILHSNCDDSDSKSNVQTFPICLFFIPQWAVKPWRIARPLEFYILENKLYIYFYGYGYESSKGLAIIQDFTAHWAIKNKQMANVWTFYIESESSQLEWRMFSYDSDMDKNWVTLAQVSSKRMLDIHV